MNHGMVGSILAYPISLFIRIFDFRPLIKAFFENEETV